ncbi:hypothetical protein GIB67_011002 [Kingdonia uniflora]|uniref:SAM domain-containing protein n=1 Tax=Kingdonia uniflora TaxID=39325 RepID=A0A7J7MDA9_9MAGN|nr:hypothetical protein GIB67_011002 [Kingdonia uniflora]
MDWFSWLSRTSLEPSLVYEYSLAFTHNELEEDDLCYFNHEFLQSMGISIAKHRLEILKLVRKEKGSNLHPISRVISAIWKTKRCFIKYIHTWACQDESNAIVVVPRPSSNSMRWRGAMVKRNKKLTMLKQGRLMMLTNGPSKGSYNPSPISSSPMVYNLHEEEDKGGKDDYWSMTRVEEIRWEALFQDMKPT